MKNVMGIINLVNEWNDLEELTYYRTVASVPFGGRYRLIDFVLSSMVNAGMDSVSVFAHTKYRSLMDHLGSGKEWDLDRKRNGLFVLPPAVDETREILRGDLYNFYHNRDHFHRANQDYVLITRSHMVCNTDFRGMLDNHLETGADITIMYKEAEELSASRCRRIELDENRRILNMEDHASQSMSTNVSMEMFLMKKALLLDMIETSLAQGHDHLVRDGIMKNLHKLRIYGYPYRGYLGVVNTVQSYFRHSMELLNPQVWRELFLREQIIYTKIKDEPPAKYLEHAAVKHALIANGCTVEGKVENSILFRGVKVRKGAIVKNSILLQNCEIGENVAVENAILDKDVFINRGRVLAGEHTAPFIAVKKKVI